MSVRKVAFRQPFALLGGFGLVSLIQDFVDLQHHIAMWMEVWRELLRPIGHFVFFGWLIEWFGYEVPDWWADYFTMSTLYLAGLMRMVIVYAPTIGQGFSDFIKEYKDSMVVIFFVWPLCIALMIALYIVGQMLNDEEPSKTGPRGIFFIRGRLVDLGTEGFDPRTIPDRIHIFVESFLWAAIILAISEALKILGV